MNLIGRRQETSVSPLILFIRSTADDIILWVLNTSSALQPINIHKKRKNFENLFLRNINVRVCFFNKQKQHEQRIEKKNKE